MGQPSLSALLQVLVLLMRYALGDLHKMKQFVVGKASQVCGPFPSPDPPRPGSATLVECDRSLRVTRKCVGPLL